MRRTAIATASAVLALALVLAPAAGVNAAPAVEPRAVAAVTPPGGFNPKIFMLNILGSVLGAATPNSWRREVLAYNNRFNISWDLLDAQFGTQSGSFAGYSGPPDSYDDYVLRRADQALKGNVSATGTGPMRAPATKFAGLVRGAGVAGAVFTGLQMGVLAGLGISEMLGVDTANSVCTSLPGAPGPLVDILTGVDCDAWSMPADFQANSDDPGGWSGGSHCNGSVCATLQAWTVPAGFPTRAAYCWSVTGSSATSIVVHFRRVVGAATNGTWSNSVMVTTAGGGFERPACTALLGSSGYTHTWGDYSGPTSDPNREIVQWSLIAPTAPGFTYAQTGASDADPERTLDCAMTGTDGIHYVAQTSPFQETDGAIPPVVCPVLPPGVAPVNTTITEEGGGNSHELYNEDTTDEYLDWHSRPECRDGACKLDLLSTTATVPVSCFDLGETCASWFTDPAKIDNYECQYGYETVDLAECNVYSGVFQPQRVQIGAPYSDPITGEWSGGQSSPNEATGLMGTPVANPTLSRSCWGQGWAEFNPVEWIMRPVQCALEWAFVPRPLVVQVEGLKVTDAFQDRAPGQVAELVGDFSVAPDIGGCSIELPFPIGFGQPSQQVTVVDACPGSYLAPAAAISRAALNISALVLVVVLIRRQVSGTVDFKGN